MASDSLSIRDVGKRAPDLTGDTGKQEKGPQIRRCSLPHIHMRCFFRSKTKTSRNLLHSVVSKSPDFVCEEVIVDLGQHPDLPYLFIIFSCQYATLSFTLGVW